MKKVSTICMLIATTLFFGCEGPEGPLGPQGLKGDQGEIGALGPQGDTGSTGANGTNGTNGQDGNANVVYSAWIAPDWASNGNNANYAEFKLKDTANSMLTQDAVDKGVVYTYIKANSLRYNADTGEYELAERIVPNGTNAYFKIAGRGTNEIRDFGRSYIYVDNSIGVNYLNVYSYLFKLGWDENYTDSETPIAEFENKSFAFYNDLVKDTYKYRVVVVHGSTQGRTNVDMSDYEAVKRAYNLPD